MTPGWKMRKGGPEASVPVAASAGCPEQSLLGRRGLAVASVLNREPERDCSLLKRQFSPR